MLTPTTFDFLRMAGRPPIYFTISAMTSTTGNTIGSTLDSDAQHGI